MTGLDGLRACAGAWEGRYHLFLPPDPPRESLSKAVVIPVLGGMFVQIDYSWLFEGAAQEGKLLIGYEQQRGRFTMAWGDTFHMGDKLMACQGQAADDGAITVDGMYAVEPGPDWGWRTVLSTGAEGNLQLQMYNVSPDGEAILAVEVSYNRQA